MLKLRVRGIEYFDDATQTFMTPNSWTVLLEHSLVSLSRWESKWEQPFLDNKGLTDEQTVDYIRMMVVEGDFSPERFGELTADEIKEVTDYIASKQTATWFSEFPGVPQKKQVITAELIYSWMVSLGIPFECETWHLNRLITLIRIIQIQNSPKKKVPFNDLAEKQRQLNAKRREELKTRG